MEEFDILEYLSGLTGYVFDKAVLKRIAWEREVSDVTSFDELDVRHAIYFAQTCFTLRTHHLTCGQALHNHTAVFLTPLVAKRYMPKRKSVFLIK